MKEFYLYDTLSRKMVPFQSLHAGRVSMYSCGPTVYNYAHIGNLRSFLFSDVLHRTLRYCGYEVDLVMNLTDVDDKTIRDSQREGKTLKDFTQVYINAFMEDIETLGILKAIAYPKATDYVGKMIEIIQKLEQEGHTYTSDGSVYFKIDTFESYGKLNHIHKDQFQMGRGHRVDVDEYDKENVSDFVLWKTYTPKDGAVYWDSPYGKGRPGWHIECSAMSMSLLGESIDLHTGGVDNAFPHHENEIAQSECYSHKTFSRYWMHCAHLMVDGNKMSKSLGNVYTLRDLISKGFSPKAIRYELIRTHYRGSFNFTFEGVKEAQKPISRVNRFLSDLKERMTGKREPSSRRGEGLREIGKDMKKFDDCLLDDLNTSGALGALFEMIHHYYSHQDILGTVEIEAIHRFMLGVNSVFNVFDFEEKEDFPEAVKVLLEERLRARESKDWKRADEIRQAVEQLGYEVRDTPEGQKVESK